MPDIAVRVDHVSKKFTKGEAHDSLRDLVPSFVAGLFSGKRPASRSDREFWALQDISFEVGRGEAVGIIGPNGAGKSTMLKLLSRVMNPTRGALHVDGRLSALIELTAGFHPDLTGRENIYLHGAILGMSRRDISAKLTEIIDFSGICEFIDTPVKRYSSGMFARLGFAIVAHVNPDVLIVDEVLSVGDTSFQRQCTERMKTVIKNGATVLFVSHDLKSVADFCSRTVLIDRGRLIRVGRTSEVITHYLSGLHKDRSADQSSPVVISGVTVSDENGSCEKFKSGAKARIEIEVSANESCRDIAVGLILRDEAHNLLLATSTERLGDGSVSLNRGDLFRCTFEVNLNLGRGVFFLSANLFRYDIGKLYDYWEAAATLYVWPDEDIEGTVNCFPRVVDQRMIQRDTRAISEGADALVLQGSK